VTARRGAGLAVVIGVLVAAALLSPGLGRAPFDDPGEGQHAEIARELVGGSWLTLRLNGVRYFDKPPLLYWLDATSFRLFGFTEWAARLAPLLGALLAVAATTLLGARLLGPGEGVLAGTALVSCALFAAFARYVRPETLFVAAIQWGFTGLLLTRPASMNPVPAGSWALAGCAALGVASLAKDPLGLIGPLAAIGAARALAGRLRPVWAWLPRSGVGLMALIGLGWYAVVGLSERSFLWYTVVDNHLLNAVRMRAFPDEDVPLGALEFLAAAAFGAFPWILAAGAAVVALARRRAWREPAEIPWVALALWAVGVLVLFTLSPFKLPHYGLPAYPALALLAARAWRDAAARPRPLLAAHLVAMGLAGAGCAWAAIHDGQAFTAAVFGISDVYSRKEAAWGQASPYPSWSALQPLVASAAVILLASAVALAVAVVRRSARAGAAAVAVAMLLMVPVVSTGLAVTSSARAVSGMAQEIRGRLAPEDVLVVEGPIENAGAVEFYSERRPALLDGERSVLGIGATFPDAAATFWSSAQFARAWSSPRPPYLLTTREPARSIVAVLPPGSARLLLAQNGRWLYGHAPVADGPAATR
jgi:4-amino-4-deoxy-L-arabinose transferase-like glycosyltransferase